jgi:hypothetical protein
MTLGKYFLWSILALVLSGCAATGTPQDTVQRPAPVGAAAPAPPGAATPVVAELPLTVPATSTKRLVLNMTGPDFVTGAKDWARFQEEWRATFVDHAKEAGIAFDVQNGDAKPTGKNGILLRVYVNDYRLVGIGSRIFFGVMTGNAYIDAKAAYTDLYDGKEYGERTYNTSSSAWAGVFAKMTPQQVDQIATKVFAELATAAGN